MSGTSGNAAWRFSPIPDDQVNPDVTQRDQFNNDALELFEALVREAIQNSTDQPNGEGPVRLRFAIRSLDIAGAAELRELLSPLRRHCEACKLDVRVLDAPGPRVMLVEDFNTTGLAGSFNTHDDGQFAGFWRRHGGSSKDSTKAGSHGLGKLVFSASSALGAVFGHTIRADGRSLLMGQAILNNHRLDGQRLPAHGFWTPTHERGRIQLPSEDAEEIRRLSALFGFSRRKETGLSIAVPYVTSEITEQDLTVAVVRNYFFPILAGDLIVEVGDLVISRETFRDVERQVPGLERDDHYRLNFVRSLLPMLESAPEVVLPSSFAGQRLGAEPIPADVLGRMQAAWTAGHMVSLRVPITIRPKRDNDVDTWFDLYLAKKPDDAAPWALFARNSLVVPGESRKSFSEPAFGALIARDPGVCAILRDAEDPAHTRWNAKEKLKKNWRYGEATVRDIRLSLKALYRELTAELREQHQNLLLDFLSVRDEGKQKGKRPRTPSKPRDPIPQRPRFFREEKIAGGFRIGAGPGAADREMPVRIRIRVAYDVLSGNPFKLHSEHDFSFRKKVLSVDGRGTKVTEVEHGAFVLECSDPDFFVEVTGFDPNRDLIVEPRISEA